MLPPRCHPERSDSGVEPAGRFGFAKSGSRGTGDVTLYSKRYNPTSIPSPDPADAPSLGSGSTPKTSHRDVFSAQDDSEGESALTACALSVSFAATSPEVRDFGHIKALPLGERACWGIISVCALSDGFATTSPGVRGFGYPRPSLRAVILSGAGALFGQFKFGVDGLVVRIAKIQNSPISSGNQFCHDSWQINAFGYRFPAFYYLIVRESR